MSREKASARGRLDTRKATAQALVEICTGGIPGLRSDDASVLDFLTAARHHRLAPLAHVRLRESHPDVARSLRADRDRALAGHVKALAELTELGGLLEGIPWVAVKGPILSAFAHPAPGLRPYNDLDVVVSPTSLREACGRLISAGWRVQETARTLLLPGEVPGEMNWRSPRGVALDLHWTFLAQRSIRSRFRLDTDALLERRTTRSVLSVDVPTLHPVDGFAHVCLHAAEAGASRMLFLLDVDQLSRQVGDWDQVVATLESWAAGPAAAVVLGRTRAVLGTPSLAPVERRLAGGAGSLALHHAVNALVPVPRVRRQASLPRVVARAARPSAAGTCLALAGKGVRSAGDALRTAARRPTPPDRPTRADPETISCYVSNVEAEARAVRFA